VTCADQGLRISRVGTGARFGDDSVRDLREQAERDARARLGVDRWVEAYAVGRRSSIDAMLKDIDSAVG
jgi:hypothetical protein